MDAAGATDDGAEAMKTGPRIAIRLRDEIITGHLEPGEPLRLMQLAQRLGVSTTPIREALMILERRGLLESQLHRGFRVAEITAEDVADIYSVHSRVSELLAERATRRLSEEDVDELEELDRRMQEADAAGDAVRAADLNHAFHRRLNLAAGSPLLVRLLGETTPFVARRLDPAAPGWVVQRMEGHAAIVAALRKRNGAEVARLIGEHIQRTGELASELAAARAQAREPSAAADAR